MLGAKFSSSLLSRSVAASVRRRTMSAVPATMRVSIFCLRHPYSLFATANLMIILIWSMRLQTDRLRLCEKLEMLML
jgi:hypothetical protein